MPNPFSKRAKEAREDRKADRRVAKQRAQEAARVTSFDAAGQPQCPDCGNTMFRSVTGYKCTCTPGRWIPEKNIKRP